MPADQHEHPEEPICPVAPSDSVATGGTGAGLPRYDADGILVREPSTGSWTSDGRAVEATPGPPLRPPTTAEQVAAVAACEPGPELADWLDSLDTATLPVEIVVEAVAAAARLEAAAHARTASLAAGLARRPEMRPDLSAFTSRAPMLRSVAGDELAMRLATSPLTANRLVREGLAFEGQLYATGEALAAGRLDAARASLLVQRLGELPEPITVAVEDRLLPVAHRRSLAQLRLDIEHALADIDPEEAAARHAQARRGRRVTRPRPEADGMASMWLVLAAEDAVRVDGVLDHAARAARSCGDPRTQDQIRADGLRDLVVGDVGAGEGPVSEVAHHDFVLDERVATVVLHQPVATSDAHPSPEHLPDRATPGTVASAAGASGAALPDAALVDAALSDAALSDAAASITAVPGTAVPGTAVPGTAVPGTAASDTAVSIAESRPETVTTTGTGRTRCTCGGGDSGGRTGARVDVTVAASTLLGLDDEPGHLDGYGPVPATTARALAEDGVWRRIVTDPLSGAVLDYGRTRYRPPTALAEHVRVRDRHCAAPGCTIPASRADLDHTVEYHRQVGDPPDAPLGTTSADNLGPLCRRHHRLKTCGGFRLRQLAPGLYEWITPGGHRYRVRPGTDHLTDLTSRLRRAREPIPF